MTTQLVGVSAMVLLSLALFLLVFGIIGSSNSMVYGYLKQYIEKLDHDLKFIRTKTTGKNLFLSQASIICALGVVVALTSPLLLILLPIVIIGPTLQLKNLRERRVARIEQQLDGWLLVLANALKAVPSIGEALISSRSLAHAPISEEVDVAIKENQLGTPLDDAMQHMADRIGSRVVATAIITLKVARRTGGDLPSTLEVSAASLREMARLQGVIRTKTADGRNQAFVLGSMPAVIIVALYFAQPSLLMKLVETDMGHILIGVALFLWIGAILTAMKILQVDI